MPQPVSLPTSDNLPQIWRMTLEELAVLVSPATLNTLATQLKLKQIDNGIATLVCANPFWRQQIETRYYNLLKQLLEKYTKQQLSLVFEVGQVEKDAGPRPNLPLFQAQQTADQLSQQIIRRARLIPDYTFDNFAVGSTNQLAFAAAEAVTQSPGQAYNPLFIWGGVGVGKTHLMQAIAHALLKKNPQLKVICCPGEEFTNEIVEAIRTKTTMAFKERYRRMELLLLDDVQFLAGKDTAQEEFFHTFNAIQRAGGQIVLTSDRPPSEIVKLEDRLRSRFEAGLIVDIAPPDFELRTAIILIKSQQSGLEIEMEAAQLIAQKFQSAREMEGFLKQLKLKLPLGESQISTALVEQLLGQAQQEIRLKRTTRPADIIRVTSHVFGVKPSQIKGKRRLARIVLPRQVCMYLMREELGYPYETIGNYFDKDHTTIIHSVEKIHKLLGNSPELAEQILEIKQSLR